MFEMLFGFDLQLYDTGGESGGGKYIFNAHSHSKMPMAG